MYLDKFLLYSITKPMAP